MKRKLILIVFFCAVLLVGATYHVQAATSNASVGGNGLKVSPVRTDLTIKPGESRTVTVFVQNVTTAATTLQVLINDFVAGGDETGKPNLILDATKSAPQHGLKQYVAPVPNVSLKAGEQKQVTVTVKIPTNAAGGGYYGAVRFAPAGLDGDKNVNLAASVGSLILIKVPGDVKEQLSIASFDVRKGNAASLFFTSPKNLSAVIRFQNGGNVQVEPFGKVTVEHGDTTLQTTEINNVDPRTSVLPDSIRRYDVPLQKLGGLGKYSVRGSFGYGTNGQLVSATTTVYIIPLWLLIIGAACVLAVVFGGIYGAHRRKNRPRRRHR